MLDLKLVEVLQAGCVVVVRWGPAMMWAAEFWTLNKWGWRLNW